MQQELKQIKAENKKLQDQLDGKGQTNQESADGGNGATTTAADNKDIKAIEKRLKEAKAWAADHPGQNAFSDVVAAIQAELDAAKPPPKSVPTGELQAELERLQGCNERVKKQVEG